MISTKQQQAWKLRPTLKKDKETTRTNSQRGCMICGPPFNLNLQQCPWSPDYCSKEGKLTEAMFHMWTDIKNKNQRQRRERENLFPAPFVNSPSGLTTQVRGESKHHESHRMLWSYACCLLFVVILWETSLLQNVCVWLHCDVVTGGAQWLTSLCSQEAAFSYCFESWQFLEVFLPTVTVCLLIGHRLVVGVFFIIIESLPRDITLRWLLLWFGAI